MARNDGGKDGGRIQRPQRCQNRRGKALGQRAGALDPDDLGQNGQRDLFRRLGPNGKADGRVERFHPRGVESGFGQLAAHQRGAAPAAHHTDIRSGLLQNSGQALQVAVVRTGDDHKIALRTAGNFGKALRKGGAKHFLRPGVPQIVGKIRPVFQRTNGQPQKPCQPHHRSAHMAAAADHEPRSRAEPLRKHAEPLQLLHAAGRDLPQRRQPPAQARCRMFRPERHTAAQQKLRTRRFTFQHGGQQGITRCMV